MKSERLHNLIGNVGKLVSVLDSWIEMHNSTKLKLRICTTSLPTSSSITMATIKVCGTSACHAGWLYLILADQSGPSYVNPYTHHEEDKLLKQAWKALVEQPVDENDYQLGILLLARFIGFANSAEMFEFFDSHPFILGLYCSKDLFLSEPFWTEFEDFQKILDAKQIDSNEDLRIVAEWWRYILSMLNKLLFFIRHVEDTIDIRQKTTISILDAAANLDPLHIHELLYNEKYSLLLENIIKPCTNVLMMPLEEEVDPNLITPEN